MKRSYKIDNEYNNSRLDRWFKRIICEIPQSLIEKNIRKGKIKVNKKKAKSSYKLKIDDEIEIFDINLKPNEHKKKMVRYKATKNELTSSSSMFVDVNENFVVLNKPAGIAVQSGTKSVRNLFDILRETNEFKNATPFPVHRIDKDTTGILIVAKNRKYAQLFTSLFRIRKIHKTYLGIVMGELNKKKGTLIDELIYYEGDNKVKAKAITHYTVLDSNNNYSLLKLNPETGRKHQLRRQLLLHGHPILGDTKYRISTNKKSKSSNLMLHAYKINFSISNLKYNFSAEPPKKFLDLLNEKYLKIR